MLLLLSADLHDIKLRVNQMIVHSQIPTEATDTCKTLMLRPTLLRLAELDPLVMPTAWALHPPASVGVPSAAMRIHYWTLCDMTLRLGPKIEYEFLERFYTLGHAITEAYYERSIAQLQHQRHTRKVDRLWEYHMTASQRVELQVLA